MNCGQALAPAPEGPGAPAVSITPTKTTAHWWVLGAILGLAALMFALDLTGILRLRGKQPGSVLTRAHDDLGTVLPAAGRESGPSLPAAGREKRVMPDDVRAWLEHLERIEKAKQELQQDQLDDLRIAMGSIQQRVLGIATEGLLDPDAPDAPAAGVESFLPVTKMTEDWIRLRQRFNEEGPPVPAECKDLRDLYDGVLMQVPGTLKDIDEIAGNLFDPEKKDKIRDLREISKRHTDVIDKPLRRSDRVLGEICDRYDTRKWFDIKVDSGGGVFGLLGGLGGLGGF